MGRTIFVLILTLIALPFIAYYWDQPLAPPILQTLIQAFQIMLGIALACFLVSEITQNYSQVDKIWSIVPAVYAWFFTCHAGFNERMVGMACLVTVWGMRLTYNFGRRGGYSLKFWEGEEDYRWGILRQNPMLKGRWRWGLFNLFFISLYQNSLILLFTLPMVVAWQGASSPLNWLDFLAAGLMLLFVILETVADQQQYLFQTEKYRRLKSGLPLNAEQQLGFISSGLWSRVRHPNYASEQAIWLSFYLFSVAATGRWVNWSLIGVVLLLFLFLGSSDFSEKISAGKYPSYKEYQQKVGRFFPKLF